MAVQANDSRRPGVLGAFFMVAIGLWIFMQTTVGELVETIGSYLPGGNEPKHAGPKGSAFAPGRGGRGRLLRRRYIGFLKRQIGGDYQWGGTTRKGGFDCSGITYRFFTKNGYANFPRTSEEQIAHAQQLTIGRAAKTAGAVVYHTGHIAISAGDGIHTYEAMGEAYGVVKGELAGRPWTQAGIFPELV